MRSTTPSWTWSTWKKGCDNVVPRFHALDEESGLDTWEDVKLYSCYTCAGDLCNEDEADETNGLSPGAIWGLAFGGVMLCGVCFFVALRLIKN